MAGTDHPYFYDEKTGEEYEVNWDSNYGFPFGYWPIDANNTYSFEVGDPYSTHETPALNAAREYTKDMLTGDAYQDAEIIADELADLVNDIKNYGYQYDEDNEEYVSSDGSDSFSIEDKANEITEHLYGWMSSNTVLNLTQDAIETMSPPDTNTVEETIKNDIYNAYDFDTKEDIDHILREFGSDWDSYFSSGYTEGRIWPSAEIISFYTTEQPNPRDLQYVMQELSKVPEIECTYNDILDFHIIFENWANGNGEVTACTVSDYISGNYGNHEEDDDDDEDETQYARSGETRFIPHLANQDQKRIYYQSFRDTRDKYKYAPMEKAAGSVARYNAMRHPYGESKQPRNIIITEQQLNRLFLMNEEESPWYEPNNAKKGTNLKTLWGKIKEKQQQLFDETFNDIDELTRKKANLFGSQHLKVPRVIAIAGNSKLPENVLMVNITAAVACPSYFMGMCQIEHGACYAMRDENQYDGARYRSFNTDLLNTELLRKYQKGNKKPMRDYFRLIEMYINIANAAAKNYYRDAIQKIMMANGGEEPSREEMLTIMKMADAIKIKQIRLNERGDFPCQLSVDLWSDFANKLGKKYGIQVNAYTARDLDFSNVSDNMAIMPSRQDINIGDEPYRKFKAVTDEFYDKLIGGNKVRKDGQPVLGKRENGELFYKCPCTSLKSTCNICQVCFNKNKTGVPYTIYVRYHGLKNANGMKNLFTNDEMKEIMDKYQDENWTSERENNMRQSRKQNLDNYSQKVLNQRKTKPEGENNEPETKSTKQTKKKQNEKNN